MDPFHDLSTHPLLEYVPLRLRTHVPGYSSFSIGRISRPMACNRYQHCPILCCSYPQGKTGGGGCPVFRLCFVSNNPSDRQHRRCLWGTRRTCHSERTVRSPFSRRHGIFIYI